jgi:hypothetical protein
MSDSLSKLDKHFSKESDKKVFNREKLLGNLLINNKSLFEASNERDSLVELINKLVLFV